MNTLPAAWHTFPAQSNLKFLECRVSKGEENNAAEAAFGQEVIALSKSTDVDLDPLRAAEPGCPLYVFTAVLWLLSSIL